MNAEICEIEIENTFRGKTSWSFALFIDIRANRFVKPLKMIVDKSYYYAKFSFGLKKGEGYLYITKFGTREGVSLQISLVRIREDCGLEYKKSVSFLFKYPNTFSPRRAKCVFADSEAVGDFAAWAGWDPDKLNLLFEKQYSERDIGNLLLLF
jgi:hypothetical protein